MARMGRSIGDQMRKSILRRVCFCLLAGLSVAGCRSRSDLVEAELRTRDAELRQLRTDLHRSEGLNFALQSELQCRGGIATPAQPYFETLPSPVAAMTGTIRQLVFGRGTGGIDEDKWPGDEALLVVLVPKDVDGSAIKVPGNLVVIASEVTPEGVKLPLSQWDVPSLQLQKMWQSGLLSSGYHVKLPWKKWPTTEKLRITCQFTTLPDNRLYEVDRDVTVRLAPGVPRWAPGTVVPTPVHPDAGPIPEGAMPVLPPGAWLREGDPATLLSSGKPALPAQRARLLEPVVKPND